MAHVGPLELFQQALDTLRSLDWAGTSNPHKRYANQFRTRDLPPVGATFPIELAPWFNVTDVGQGGTIVIRSPHLWCTHTVTESRSAIKGFTQRTQVRTGPASEAHVWVASQSTVITTVHRRTDPANDPIVDPVTGLISGVGGDANPGSAEQVLAYFMRGVLPHAIIRPPMAYIFSSAEPRDGGQPPIAPIETALGYAPYLYRRAVIETAVIGGNVWNVRGPDAFPAGPLFETTAGTRSVLIPDVWNYVSVVPATLRNMTLQWQTAALLP